jgi:glycosyltransferase EpsH
MNKISIIIPLFKSEFFLNKLNYSLVHQTYSNLEIIYVNDGSPDNSLKLVQEFQLHDSRIKIIDKNNEGQAAALNDGIAMCTGDFIMFIDADDWIELNTCELAIDAATRYDVDMVFWPNIKEYPTKSIKYPSFFPSSKLFKGEDIIYLRRRMIGLINDELINPLSTDAFNAGWGKIYKAEIIKKNKIIWTDTKIVGSSDVLFNAQLMPYIKSAYYLDVHLYHYNKCNPNSHTKTYNNSLKIKMENLFKELNHIIQEKYFDLKEKKDFEQALNNRIALSTINISLGYVSKGISYSGFKFFKNLISSNPFKNSYKKFTIKYLPFYYRPFFFFCKFNIALPAFIIILIISKLRQK